MIPLSAQAQDGEAPVADDEPVISEDAFEAALPDFDSDVEVRETAPPPASRPDDLQGVPALTDGEAAELLPDPPLSDPALAGPLVPLEGFDVQVPNPPTEEAAAAAPEIRYFLATEGLSEVGLEDEFRDVSALVEGGETAANAAMLSARAEEDAELAVRLLRSEGYFDATAASEIVLPPEPDGRYRVEIVASPGSRYEFSSVRVVGEDKAIPPGLVSDNLELDAGEPIVAEQVLSAEASMSLVFPFNGYPFAEVQERDILLDGETKTGAYTPAGRSRPARQLPHVPQRGRRGLRSRAYRRAGPVRPGASFTMSGSRTTCARR